MKETLTTALVNLLKVKSIVTIMLIAVFCFLAIRKDINGDQFLTIVTTVVAFYFGTQAEQRSK